MTSDLMIRIHRTIDMMNHGQQSVARNYLTNPEYVVAEMFVFGENKLVIKSLKTGEVWNFADFVRASCNCG